MFRALSMIVLLFAATPAGAEATESDTGKSPALHAIVGTRVQIAFAQTRATVSGLMMAAQQRSDDLCMQTSEPIGCQLAYRIFYGSVERLETDLLRLDALALSAKMTLDQDLFYDEKKRIDDECVRFAEEFDELEATYPLVPLGP